MLQLRCLFWISEIIVVMLVIIPIARFLLYQWSLRELEFVNRFSQGSLGVYLALLRSHRGAKGTVRYPTVPVVVQAPYRATPVLYSNGNADGHRRIAWRLGDHDGHPHRL
jgi:hypothetical protein